MTISNKVPDYDPSQFNFTGDAVDYWSETGGDPVAMVWNPPGNQHPKHAQALSFSHFTNRSRQVALGLRRLGIHRGDILFLMSSKTPEWYEIFCGCIRAGVVVCPCPKALVPSDIKDRIIQTGASAFVGNAKETTWLSEVQREAPDAFSVRCIIQFGSEITPSLDGHTHSYLSLMQSETESAERETFSTQSSDPCLLYFTSGTTGRPKVVQHTHVSYPYAHALTGASWLDIRPGKLLWNTSDQGWAKSTWAFFGAWTQGAALFLDADEGPFDPERLVKILNRFDITHFCAAPTVYRQLTVEGIEELFEMHPVKALEHCLSAGESLSAQVILRWSELTEGLLIWDGYGQSETTALCGNQPSIPQKLGSMAPYEEGSIAVKTTGNGNFLGIFKGYIQNDGSVLRPQIEDSEHQCWYLTGDNGYYDEEGYFWFKGRQDDVIISAGHRIGPAEIESILHCHPAVIESAVVESPDEKRGAAIKAFIVLRADRTCTQSEAQLRQDIQAHCLQYKTAAYCPQKVEFVSSDFLPKTVSGKVIRKSLRLLEMERTGPEI